MTGAKGSVDHVVYVVRSAAGRLLYVGVTNNLRLRMGVHRSQSPWWSPTIQVTVEHFPHRGLSERREKELIEQLKPPFNRPPKKLVLVDPTMQDEVRRVAYALRVDPMELLRQMLRRELDQVPVSPGSRATTGPHAAGCECFDATSSGGWLHIDERCATLELVASETTAVDHDVRPDPTDACAAHDDAHLGQRCPDLTL